MASEPQIVPGTPTINQGANVSELNTDTPAERAATEKNVLDIFDRVLPAKGPKAVAPTPTPPTPTPAPTPAPVPTPTPPTPEPVPTPTEIPARGEPLKTPSFIEAQLRGTEAPPAPVSEDDIPENPPEFKTPEERTSFYRNWRERYNKQKSELKTLRERPTADPERLKYLEGENKTLNERLSQLGVEQNAEFQRTILQPMHNAWNAAARIVKDAGGNPQELAKAMNLTGQAHYEAMDEIYSGMPESAKMEAQQAVQAYRHFAQQRALALKDAPKTQAELRKRELERNYAFIQNQKKEMGVLFDNAVATLRDEAKLEVL